MTLKEGMKIRVKPEKWTEFENIIGPEYLKYYEGINTVVFEPGKGLHIVRKNSQSYGWFKLDSREWFNLFEKVTILNYKDLK